MKVPTWVCLLVVLLAGSGEAQPAEQLFMFATRGPTPVTDLVSEEVVIERDGSQCKVVTLQPDRVGMKVALVVDNSEAATAIVPLREGLARFLEALPERHSVGLVTIAGQARLRGDFTTDRTELKRTAGALFPVDHTGALIVHGLMETWRRRFSEDDAWPVFVLVLHDGGDASRRIQDEQYDGFVRELIARGAVVNAVVVSTSGVDVQTALSLNLTRNTGGLFSSMMVATALPEALEALGTSMGAYYDAFKNSYRVAFQCEADGQGGQARITVTRPGVAVTFFDNRRMVP